MNEYYEINKLLINIHDPKCSPINNGISSHLQSSPSPFGIELTSIRRNLTTEIESNVRTMDQRSLCQTKSVQSYEQKSVNMPSRTRSISPGQRTILNDDDDSDDEDDDDSDQEEEIITGSDTRGLSPVRKNDEDATKNVQNRSLFAEISTLIPAFISTNELKNIIFNTADFLVGGELKFDEQRKKRFEENVERILDNLSREQNAIWNVGNDTSCVNKESLAQSKFFYEFVSIIGTGAIGMAVQVNEIVGSENLIDLLKTQKITGTKGPLFKESTQRKTSTSLGVQTRGRTTESSLRGATTPGVKRKDISPSNNALQRQLEIDITDIETIEPRVLKVIVDKQAYDQELEILAFLNGLVSQNQFKLKEEKKNNQGLFGKILDTLFVETDDIRLKKSPNVMTIYNSFTCQRLPSPSNSNGWNLFVEGLQNLESKIFSKTQLEIRRQRGGFIGYFVLELASLNNVEIFFQTPQWRRLTTKLDKVYSLGLQLAHATHWMHRRLVLHRDMHYGNILIDNLPEKGPLRFDSIEYRIGGGRYRLHQIQTFTEEERKKSGFQTPLNIILNDFDQSIKVNNLKESTVVTSSTSRIDVRSPELMFPIDFKPIVTKSITRFVGSTSHSSAIDVWALASVLSRWFSNDQSNGGLMDPIVSLDMIGPYIYYPITRQQQLKLQQQLVIDISDENSDINRVFKSKIESVENVIAAFQFTNEFIRWSRDQTRSFLISNFTESGRLDTNIRVALQLWNIMQRFGTDLMFIWLRKLNQSGVKDSIINQYVDFFESTKNIINEFLLEYNNSISVNDRLNQQRIQFEYPKEESIEKNYTFNSNMNQEEKNVLLEIFKRVFQWDPEQRPTSEWILLKLREAAQKSNELKKAFIINQNEKSTFVVESELLEQNEFLLQNKSKSNSENNKKNEKFDKFDDDMDLNHKCNYCCQDFSISDENDLTKRLKRCKKCKSRYYCSSKCAQMDWNYGAHSLLCKTN